MSKRSREMQLWADKEFCLRLDHLKAEMTLIGAKNIKSKGDLTRMIIKTNAWRKVEEEIKQQNRMRGLKFDGLI